MQRRLTLHSQERRIWTIVVHQFKTVCRKYRDPSVQPIHGSRCSGCRTSASERKGKEREREKDRMNEKKKKEKGHRPRGESLLRRRNT